MARGGHSDAWYGKLFLKIGPQMGSEFTAIGINLDFKDSDLKNIRDSHREAKLWGNQLLTEWKEKQPIGANLIAILTKALSDSGRNDLAGQVENEHAKSAGEVQVQQVTPAPQVAQVDNPVYNNPQQPMEEDDDTDYSLR
ncbi:unnamed protein product [Owenia fusiformis]|uniref:Death domain-containing protein n=1 Tax=Owenia fusiformis TaxID=6347 RepID=A0A8S4Q5B8_OWEFU|nr:unnamed protein product [Owenia fusiformis]